MSAEGIEPRADLFDVPFSFGLEQNAQSSKGSKTEAHRCTTAFVLVEQDEIGLELEGQHQSFGLSEIEISSENRCRSLVAHLVAINP